MSDLLNHNVLIINQKAKLIELTNEYRILDEDGHQVGQSKAKKLLRAVSNVDSLMTHRLSVYDAAGAKVIDFVRPRTMWKSSIEVSDGSGRLVGKMHQKNMFGKRAFALEDAAGNEIGAIRSENWLAWDMSIQDHAGTEIGRITKKWGGVIKATFTTADNYMLQITGEVTPDLRLMMLASAAGVDVALKQGEA